MKIVYMKNIFNLSFYFISSDSKFKNIFRRSDSKLRLCSRNLKNFEILWRENWLRKPLKRQIFYAERTFLPFFLLFESTALPAFVAMRALKPWVLLLLSVLGWNVLFISILLNLDVHYSLKNEKTTHIINKLMKFIYKQVIHKKY